MPPPKTEPAQRWRFRIDQPTRRLEGNIKRLQKMTHVKHLYAGRHPGPTVRGYIEFHRTVKHAYVDKVLLRPTNAEPATGGRAANRTRATKDAESLLALK